MVFSPVAHVEGAPHDKLKSWILQSFDSLLKDLEIFNDMVKPDSPISPDDRLQAMALDGDVPESLTELIRELIDYYHESFLCLDRPDVGSPDMKSNRALLTGIIKRFYPELTIRKFLEKFLPPESFEESFIIYQSDDKVQESKGDGDDANTRTNIELHRLSNSNSAARNSISSDVVERDVLNKTISSDQDLLDHFVINGACIIFTKDTSRYNLRINLNSSGTSSEAKLTTLELIIGLINCLGSNGFFEVFSEKIAKILLNNLEILSQEQVGFFLRAITPHMWKQYIDEDGYGLPSVIERYKLSAKAGLIIAGLSKDILWNAVFFISDAALQDFMRARCLSLQDKQFALKKSGKAVCLREELLEAVKHQQADDSKEHTDQHFLLNEGLFLQCIITDFSDLESFLIDNINMLKQPKTFFDNVLRKLTIDYLRNIISDLGKLRRFFQLILIIFREGDKNSELFIKFAAAFLEEEYFEKFIIGSESLGKLCYIVGSDLFFEKFKRLSAECITKHVPDSNRLRDIFRSLKSKDHKKFIGCLGATHLQRIIKTSPDLIETFDKLTEDNSKYVAELLTSTHLKNIFCFDDVDYLFYTIKFSVEKLAIIFNMINDTDFWGKKELAMTPVKILQLFEELPGKQKGDFISKLPPSMLTDELKTKIKAIVLGNTSGSSQQQEDLQLPLASDEDKKQAKYLFRLFYKSGFFGGTFSKVSDEKLSIEAIETRARENRNSATAKALAVVGKLYQP